MDATLTSSSELVVCVQDTRIVRFVRVVHIRRSDPDHHGHDPYYHNRRGRSVRPRHMMSHKKKQQHPLAAHLPRSSNPPEARIGSSGVDEGTAEEGKHSCESALLPSLWIHPSTSSPCGLLGCCLDQE